MNNFEKKEDYNNLLPRDGHAIYYGPIFTEEEADAHFEALLKTIAWQNDSVILFGKKITTKRKTAWYGGKAYEYTYSKIKRKALPWTGDLIKIKSKVESLCGETFNTCLLNLYHDGTEGMGWHTDAEKDLRKNAAIASLSLGAERRFQFRHKEDKDIISVKLEHGSLLLMKDPTQSHWKHRLPPMAKVKQPRINLTFRSIAE